MIPKIIHYCWFGKQAKNELILKCLDSWQIHLSDFQIIEWNEDNCEIDHPYVIAAYQAKKWAFVADFIRLKVLYDLGGIYLDTDMLITKPLHSFLQHPFFIGCEQPTIISMGILGCIPRHPFIEICLKHYATKSFNAAQPVIITRLITNLMQQHGFRHAKDLIVIEDMYIYPSAYFYPFPFPPYGSYEQYINENTFAVHLWAGSWLSEWQHFIIGNPKAALKIVNTKWKKKEHQNLPYLAKATVFSLVAPFWVIKSIIRRVLRRWRNN